MMYENYLEVVMSNKAYLKNVKTMLSRTVSKDSENENNVLLKSILLKKYNNQITRILQNYSFGYLFRKKL